MKLFKHPLIFSLAVAFAITLCLVLFVSFCIAVGAVWTIISIIFMICFAVTYINKIV